MNNHETYGRNGAARACNDLPRGCNDFPRDCNELRGLCKRSEARCIGQNDDGIEVRRGCDGLKCPDSDKVRAALGGNRVAAVTMCAELTATRAESMRKHAE